MTTLEKAYRQLGYPTEEKLYQYLKPQYTRNQIKDFLSKQYVYQVHKDARKKKRISFPQTANHIDEHWQADLLILQKYKQQNRGYQYVFCAVDVFSRQAFAVALKKRDTKTIKGLLEHLFQKRSPKIMTSDNEGALSANEMDDVYKKYHVRHVKCFPGDHARMGIIERFNKTLRALLEKYMTVNETKNWLQFLETAVDAYNNSPHSSIGYVSPANISKVAWIIPQSNKVRESISAEKMIKAGYLIKAGDFVRIQIEKGIFDKAAEPTYSKDIYRVKAAVNGKYILEGSPRKYRYYELLKVDPATVRPVASRQSRPAKKTVYQEYPPTVYLGTRRRAL